VAVRALVSEHYDLLSYAYFMARLLQVGITRDLRPLFANAARTGAICSGVAVRELSAMGVDLGPLRTAAIEDPDFIAPCDLLRWAIDNEWTDRPVPAW
jgi:hypothetical protein